MNCLYLIQIVNFSAHVTLKFNWWPWKTIGHLFCAMSSFVHHFKSDRWIRTGLTVWKCSIWVKIGNFLSRVTLKFGEWPWKTTGHLFHTTSSFVKIHQWIQTSVTVQQHPILFKLGDFFVPCDLQIWWMTLKKQGKSEGFYSCDRPSNLTQIGFKSSIFQPMWPLNLMDDLKKL